jgi:hypothetical protein
LLLEKSLASFKFTTCKHGTQITQHHINCLLTNCSFTIKMNTCHFSFVVYNTRSRNVIAAIGGDLKLEEINTHFFQAQTVQ